MYTAIFDTKKQFRDINQIFSGAFFFYAGISFIGFLIFYFLLPETRGYQIEEIEMLFMSDAARKKKMAEKTSKHKSDLEKELYKD